MWPVVLSHRLPVLGLVSRYLTNYLIGHSPLPKRQSFARMAIRPRGVIMYYPQFPKAIHDFGAR